MGKLERGRCGLCCTLLVRLNDDDIKKIRALGHKEDSFIETNTRKEPLLKKINGYCRFVKIEEGIATCTIYESRPKICREYICIEPGEDRCKLQRHYSVVELKKTGGA